MNNFRLDPIVRGDPRTVAVQVRDPDGNTVDLSGSNWSSQVREKPGSETYETVTVDASGAAVGVLKLSLTGAQTRKFHQTLHGDLEGDNIGTLFSWRHVITNDVTRHSEEPTGGFVDVVEVVLGDQGAAVSGYVRAVVLADQTTEIANVQALVGEVSQTLDREITSVQADVSRIDESLTATNSDVFGLQSQLDALRARVQDLESSP